MVIVELEPIGNWIFCIATINCFCRLYAISSFRDCFCKIWRPFSGRFSMKHSFAKNLFRQMLFFYCLIEKCPNSLTKALHMFLELNKRSNCTPETSRDCDVAWGKHLTRFIPRFATHFGISLSDYRDPLVIPSTNCR